MGLSIEAVAAAGKGKKSGRKVGARVTEKVIARANDPEYGASQACIAVRGGEDVEAYRGDFILRLDGADYTLTKTDSHACWATKQGENVGDFVEAFNALSTTPNQVRGELIFG